MGCYSCQYSDYRGGLYLPRQIVFAAAKQPSRGKCRTNNRAETLAAANQRKAFVPVFQLPRQLRRQPCMGCYSCQYSDYRGGLYLPRQIVFAAAKQPSRGICRTNNRAETLAAANQRKPSCQYSQLPRQAASLAAPGLSLAFPVHARVYI